ncbi:glutamate-5-semialdehyde dehydrogenase [Secundilactobacillus paracollinoides]|uniref:Gamma-glutamyl phosphate reductase n=1 Tax=Secundilactobacillus paracollinoides TaxID=240427 RepID=A0A1B2IX62_9LACO|nr:glutamate-5-semialdehyde dehydrogenase [Secundilactobacillus paracollinoides]ANZ60779.1 gamma-glutamyl-phosphate reductase [Secundilactobacillus paracollinoides]ANZ66623.1 gamma-glutamyl-phosphate reductase [Secundilactobacillus paracollinoides]
MDNTATNLTQLGQLAQAAETQLAQLSATQRNDALVQMAAALVNHQDIILDANKRDLANATDLKQSFVDRLTLTADRIEAMAEGMRQVAQLPDPIGKVDRMWKNEAGLMIGQQRVPLGVIGIIFEARPNVTADASALCFKSGNAVILRGGKEAIQTNIAVSGVLRAALNEISLDENAIQLVHDTSHETANEMMALTDYLDVLIPRGGQGLIQHVVQNATVPVIETGAGNCHIYVDEFAELKMATDITVNAKVQRPSVCNSAEKLLIHEAVAADYLPTIAKSLQDQGVQLRGDARAQALVPGMIAATDDDWDEEYNDLIMAVKVVDSEDEAIAHINAHNTKHSEAIITDNYQNGQNFLQRIDAACVYINASTRFTDGFEFGFGAEIGISTQKLHARGPMGLNELTSTKYIIYGDGQVRK